MTSKAPGAFTGRTTRVLVLSLAVVSVVSVVSVVALLFAMPAAESFDGAYNPLTYNRNNHHSTGAQDTHSMLQHVTPLVGDDELQRRLSNTPDGRGTVYTFFNDDRIRRLSLHEQHFHRSLLRKWAMLYQSLGFFVEILHYNDAVDNPKMKDMADRRVLFDKNDIINENYLKLLAWSHRMEQLQDRHKGKGALYVDYTIFPITSKIDQLRKESTKIDKFQLVPDFEFQVMLSDRRGVDELIDALIQKNRDFNIVEGPTYGDIFADYSVSTWKKLLNTNKVKTVVDTVPALIDRHMKAWRLAKYDVLNIVDPMVIGDHYFARPALQALKALLTCEDVPYPPPTRTFLELFDRELLPHLPDRTTADSDKDEVEKAEKALKDLMSTHIFKCSPATQWKVIVSNDMNLQHRTLNFITLPHPLSAASVLKHDDKHMVTSTDLVEMDERNVISTHLIKNTKNFSRLKHYGLHRGNSIFVPAELLTVDTFAQTMSIFFGVDIPAVNDRWGVDYDDKSRSYSELGSHVFKISEGELKWKLDSAKSLVANYEFPVPFVINQRQSENRLAQYKEELKNIKGPTKLEDPKVVLQTQNFESRHDPVVEIAESWNENDADLWWSVKTSRWISWELYRLLKEVEASSA